MAKCPACGSSHCHHQYVKTEVMSHTEEGVETDRQFKRTTCADCGQWLGDELVV